MAGWTERTERTEPDRIRREAGPVRAAYSEQSAEGGKVRKNRGTEERKSGTTEKRKSAEAGTENHRMP
jgi:hypothetical protein